MGGIKNKLNKLSNKAKTLFSNLTSPTRLGSSASGTASRRTTASGVFDDSGLRSLSGPVGLLCITKYASIACFTLALISTIGLNLYRTYSSSNTLSSAEQVDSSSNNNEPSTLANDSSICDPTNTNTAACISMSITSSPSSSTGGNDANLPLSIPQGGGIATGRHTVTVSTNSVGGYKLSYWAQDKEANEDNALINTNNGNYRIEPNEADYGNYRAYPLNNDRWGFAIIPPGNVRFEVHPFSDEQAYLDNDPKATYAPVFTKSTIEQDYILSIQPSNPSAAAGDAFRFYYGVRVDNPSQLLAGDYQTQVVYTATVKLPPDPTNLSVQPNQYKLGSGEPNTITISATSGLASTYNVWIDLNSNNTYDANEQCTNLNVASDTTLTCNIPTDESITTDTPYTIYVQTQASTPTPITNAFTYTKQTGITTITDGTVAVDIDDGMIPVIYNDGTSNWESLTTAEAKTSGTWYDYGAKKWANAVTVKNPDTYKNQHKTVSSSDILGYWVYIPRYAYKVMRYSVNDKYVSDSVATGNGGFEIVFETKDTPKKTPAACSNSNSNQYYQDCSNVSQDYGATTGTAWATHPAFTWQYTQDINGFDKTYELNGFWIGKFETTGSTSQPTVLPNQKHMSQYSGNIGDMYDVAKSMGVADSNNKYGNTTSTNQSNQNNNNLAISTSHMLKNSEWGAVAYLSASKYGAGVNNVQINSQYQSGTDGNGDSSYGVTGCGPQANNDENRYSTSGTLGTSNACGSADKAYNGTLGQYASTTGNVYGVYDMSGGAYEYVMGSHTTNNTSQSSTSYFSNAAKPPYVDLYVSSIFNGNYTSNNNLCTWATCGGHALYETKNVQPVSGSYQSWGGDYSDFVNSSGPWFGRGGGAGLGSSAGVFDSNGSNGRTYTYYGFRVALLSLLTN